MHRRSAVKNVQNGGLNSEAMLTRALSLTAVGAIGGTASAIFVGERKRSARLTSSPPEFANGRSPLFAKEGKRAVVVGSGVAGVATAFALAKRGYSVAVIDAADKPGDECSKVAAGGMSRSNPVVDRATFLAVAKSFFFDKEESFFRLDWSTTLTDPHFLRWFIGLALNTLLDFSSKEKDSDQKVMLSFTDWAIDRAEEVMLELGIADRCGFNKNGWMQLSLATGSTPTPTGAAKGKSKMSLEPITTISVEEAVAKESSLEPLADRLASVKFEPVSASGDSHVFTTEVAAHCEKKLGVKFQMGTKVTGLRLDGDEVTGVVTDRGEIKIAPGDQVAVAAGSWTPQILWHAGLYVPIYPLKGYGLIMDLDKAKAKEKSLPRRVVSDSVLFTSRLGDRIRMSTMGEFCGWNTAPDPSADAYFRAAAKERQPTLSEVIDGTETVCGLRPYSNDGIVFLGRLPGIKNGFVNVGPGFNGWKIAAGTGEFLARVMDLGPDKAYFSCDGGEFEGNGGALYPEGRVKRAPLLSRMCICRWH